MKLQCIEHCVLTNSQILEGYGSQLSHLTKELSQIQKDLKEWEQPATGGFGIGT